VNEALLETVPLAGTARAEGFAELYERSFPPVYAYVGRCCATARRRGREGAGIRARIPQAPELALPLGLLALLGWLAARALRRRRRESALA